MFSVGQPIPNRKVLQKQYEAKCFRYEKILYDLQQSIKLDLNQIELSPTIKTRVKAFGSYYKKLLKLLKKFKGRQEDFLIYDVLGLRIICPFLDDLKSVETLIKGKYHVVKIEHKGKQHSFKEFGYKSIHFLIKVPSDILSHFQIEESLVCEIQLCTILQDAWSEVEHELVYKAKFSPFDEPWKRKLAALNATLTLSDTLFQEIRDYQRHLQSELEKRRKTFAKKSQTTIDTMTLSTLENSTFEKTGEDADITSGDGGVPLDISLSKNIDALLLKALDAHNAKKFKKAIDIYTSILNLEMEEYTQSLIYIHRGMAYFSDSNYEQALEDFSKSLELHQENWRAFNYRAIIHQIMRNYPSALADLNRCLELEPYQFDSLYNRATVCFHLGDYPKALADCEQALNIEPDSHQVQKLRELIKSYIHL